jgi:hypothetical protein
MPKRSEILKSARMLRCREPLLKLIKLKPPGPNFDVRNSSQLLKHSCEISLVLGIGFFCNFLFTLKQLLPSVALVKRCGGHCSHPHVCRPAKKSMKRIPVCHFNR